MPLINASAITRRAATLVAACATPLALFSAVANAEPDPAAPVVDPRAQCESPEMGGVFVTTPTPPGAIPHAECHYIIEGQFYYDNYDGGAYTGTLVYRDGAKVPTERPPMPERLEALGGLPPFFG